MPRRGGGKTRLAAAETRGRSRSRTPKRLLTGSISVCGDLYDWGKVKIAASQFKRRMQRLVADDPLRDREPDGFASQCAKIGGLNGVSYNRGLIRLLRRLGLDTSLILPVPAVAAGRQFDCCLKPSDFLQTQCMQHMEQFRQDVGIVDETMVYKFRCNLYASPECKELFRANKICVANCLLT